MKTHFIVVYLISENAKSLSEGRTHVSMCCIFSPRMDVCVFILKNGSRVFIYASVVRMHDYKIYYLQSAVFSLFTVLMQ